MKCTMEGIGKKFSSLYFSLSRAPPNGCVLSSPTLAGPPGRLAPKQQHAGQSPACVRGSPVNAGQEKVTHLVGWSRGGEVIPRRLEPCTLLCIPGGAGAKRIDFPVESQRVDPRAEASCVQNTEL